MNKKIKGKCMSKWKKDKCAANTSELSYTCYSTKTLDLLKQLWNKRHPENQIMTNDIKEIWSSLKSKFRKRSV